MVEQTTGKVILNAAPNGDVQQRISVFLARHFKNLTSEKAVAIAKKAPVVLGKNVSRKAAEFIVTNLEKLGASATYSPEEPVATGKSSETSNIIPSKVDSSQEATESSRSVPLSYKTYQSKLNWKAKLMHQVEQVNKELLMILSMIVIAGIMNYMVASHQMLLGFYTLPTLFSAYCYGRRHATLTAFASVLLVGLVVHYNPALFTRTEVFEFVQGRWYEITAWGSILVITAYAMGTLYERNTAQMRELRRTYQGLIMILRQFISKDQYTENHCYRVSIYAVRIAAYLKLNSERIEDVRSAALLHDIGKLDISRELLYKAARLTREEFEGVRSHVEKGIAILNPIEGPLGRIIPIILAHHDRYDGSGYHTTSAEEIPLEARILAVADVYDALVSDRPYRKAMSPFDAKEIIVKGSGTEFDPSVVKGFLKAFNKGQMEVPNLVV
ncbi:MAG: HD domain-containing protein [Desulfobacterales bacterium]|nr:HD domain-containing protein [Desulfobacterales bacterium]